MTLPTTGASSAQELERVQALPSAIVALLPELAQQIEGCPVDEIAELERAHQVHLPAWYRVYLETMGRSLGVIRHYANIDLRPASLRQRLNRVDWRSPRYLLFGVATAGSDTDTYIDLGDDGEGIAVVAFEYPRPGEPLVTQAWATRFSTYIFMPMAYRAKAVLPAGGYLSARSPEVGKLPALCQLLARLGVEEHPLSGAWDKVFLGAHVVATGVESGNEQPLTVSLGCTSAAEWWEIAGRLELELELKIVKSP